MAVDLKTQMLGRLIDSGTWLDRAALVAGLSSSPLAQEDALADLVIEGKAVYRQAVGYRLAGSAVQRRAAFLLRQSRTAKAVFARQEKDEYRIGVAQMCQLQAGAELSLVMYEMSMPIPANGPDYLAQHTRQVQGVIDFSQTEIDHD